MPTKRKPGIQGGTFKTEADRKRWERANETPEQTRLRLETQRELQSLDEMESRKVRCNSAPNAKASSLLTESLRLTSKLLSASMVTPEGELSEITSEAGPAEAVRPVRPWPDHFFKWPYQ